MFLDIKDRAENQIENQTIIFMISDDIVFLQTMGVPFLGSGTYFGVGGSLPARTRHS